MLEHCQRTYGEMNAAAVGVAELPEDLADLVPAWATRIYVGNLMVLTERLGYRSSQQYAAMKTSLVRMGCVSQLRRGIKQRPGAWLLLQPPTVALWDKFCSRPILRRHLQDYRERHEQALSDWLALAAVTHRPLLQQAHEAGCRTLGDLVPWLASLPERQRRELPVCLGYRGAESHTCMVEHLDPMADRSAGSWARRRDHLAQLVSE
jgi:hypothetical protein